MPYKPYDLIWTENNPYQICKHVYDITLLWIKVKRNSSKFIKFYGHAYIYIYIYDVAVAKIKWIIDYDLSTMFNFRKLWSIFVKKIV